MENTELEELFIGDQEARLNNGADVDWSELEKEDQTRRERVLELLQNQEIKTAKDYYHAAMIFQHGTRVADSRLAYSLAWISVTLDPLDDKARWLSAAAWDRMMMKQEQPQWYGTQFTRKNETRNWELYDMAKDAVTDEEREAMNVPPLSEAMEQLKQNNS